MFEMQDRSYVILPKSNIKIITKNKKAKIIIGSKIMKGRKIRINKELYIIKIKYRGKRYYLVDVITKKSYVLVRDDLEVISKFIRFILKIIIRRIKCRERIDRIRKVRLELDNYIFYYRGKSFFTEDEPVPEILYAVIGGERIPFKVAFSKDKALVPIREVNKLFIEKIKKRYLTAELRVHQTIPQEVFLGKNIKNK